MIRKLLKSHKVWKKKINKKTTTRKQNKIDIFWLLPVISGVCKSENTQSKSILAVILRGQPTLYNWRFTRYGKSSYFVIRRPPRLPPPKKCIFRALLVVWEVYISQNTHDKSSFVVILRAQPTFYQQQFARYGVWPQKWVLHTFQPDHQVSPENRPSKDSKTAAF